MNLTYLPSRLRDAVRNLALRAGGLGDQPRGLVLLYHRVARPLRDPQLLAVWPDRFADHLAVLNRCARPMALDEMVARILVGKSLPPRAVAITFDDGYSDNLLNAEPRLAAAGIPATLFVATGYAETGNPYWWDAVESAVLGSHLPARLDLPFPEGVRSWDITTPQDDYDSWTVLEASESGSPRTAYREIMAALKPLDIRSRNRALEALWLAGGGASKAEGAARPLSPQAIAQMHSRGIISIGAHTVNHPQLSALGSGDQEHEIVESAAAITNWIGGAVDLFAYPYGTTADYNATGIETVVRAGFRAACSNFPGLVRRGTSRYELPRLLMRNLSAGDFESTLNAAFAVEQR
jgi:peptidoglycan/xylan/chitin deacetylase (PgdA/CDA1 family)